MRKTVRSGLTEQLKDSVHSTNGHGNIQLQMQALGMTFKQYSEQNKKLAQLYEATQQRNQQLAHSITRFNKDIAFLKEYCQALQLELHQLGYYKCNRKEMLSRKETAEGIFITYNQSTLSLIQDFDSGQENVQLNKRICSLEDENRILKQQLQKLQNVVGENGDFWHQSYEASEERVVRLEKEVKQLRTKNSNLELERQKKGATTFIMKDREQLFNNIHHLISEYKKKINDLAHQKKEVERRYKHLREKVSRLDQNSEFKLIQLCTQKIQVLQRLTQKQQMEIESTIQLYEVQLKKIEVRRRQEIQMFQNQRLDLQSQNLRLCIDLQKSLNSKDQIAIQLMQQRNKNQLLLQEIKQLREAIQSFKKIQKTRRNLSIIHTINCGVVPDRANSVSTGSVASNLQYQYSQISQKRQLIERLQEVSLQRENSASKRSIRDRVTITYGRPNPKPYYIARPGPPPSPTNLNKSYDSVLQYKRRFIQRKPESSFNQ